MKIKKNAGYHEILELVGADDKVAHKLEYTITLDRVINHIDKLKGNYDEATRRFENGAGSLDEVYTAAIPLFNLLFGEENTKVIADWYGEEKYSMICDFGAYIATTVYPKIGMLARERAEEQKRIMQDKKRWFK